MIKNWIPKYVVVIIGILLTPFFAGVFYVSNLLLVNRNRYILEAIIFVVIYGILSTYVIQTMYQMDWVGVLLANALGTAILTMVLWPRHMAGIEQ